MIRIQYRNLVFFEKNLVRSSARIDFFLSHLRVLSISVCCRILYNDRKIYRLSSWIRCGVRLQRESSNIALGTLVTDRQLAYWFVITVPPVSSAFALLLLLEPRASKGLLGVLCVRASSHLTLHSVQRTKCGKRSPCLLAASATLMVGTNRCASSRTVGMSFLDRILLKKFSTTKG